MPVFTDKHTKLRFHLNKDNLQIAKYQQHGIDGYPLIRWTEQYVTESGVYVNIGAGIGLSSIILGRKCKEVESFEPSDNLLPALQENYTEHNLQGRIHRVALGEKAGTGELHQLTTSQYTMHPCLTTPFTCEITESQVVSVRTLDDYQLKNVDFIRISVEGSELEVLRGAGQTLWANKFPPSC